MKRSSLCLLIFSLLFLILFNSCKEESINQPNSQSDKPVVNILTPLDDTEVFGIVPILVEATDDKGIIKVEIFIDDSIMVSLVTPPYEYYWNTFNDIDSNLHIIYAKAYDADDNVSSSKVNNVIVKNFNIKYELLSDELIKFSWGFAEADSFYFVIEESVNDKDYSKFLETEKGTTSILINRIYSTDSIYKYRVTPKTDSFLYSFISDSVSFSIEITPPLNVNYEVLSDNTLKLTWIDNCHYEVGFRIERKETNSDYEFLVELPPNSTSYIDNTININTVSSYSLYTFTNHNESKRTIKYLLFPPVISNVVIEPDTLEVIGVDSIFVSVLVFDQNGLSDIGAVFFNVFLGDMLVTDDPIYLADDGNIQFNGDALAGDGIFSCITYATENTTKGRFRFEFQARDRGGLLSNIINHYVLIL